MAKDEDTRTPDQIEAHAAECRRMARETRKQAQEAAKVADDWEKLADQSDRLAATRRSAMKQQDAKAPAKRSSRKSGKK